MKCDNNNMNYLTLKVSTFLQVNVSCLKSHSLDEHSQSTSIATCTRLICKVRSVKVRIKEHFLVPPFDDNNEKNRRQEKNLMITIKITC